MTSRIAVVAGDVRINDIIYNGLGTSKHPTDVWAITQVNSVEGPIWLITGRLDGPTGEFWFEPHESVVVVRHPRAESEPAIAKPGNRRAHGH